MQAVKKENGVFVEPGHCPKCGYLMSDNPHPDAGKPESMLMVGVMKECIPCLVENRHKWARRAQRAESVLRSFGGAAWEDLPGYIIDHHEGERATEENLQAWLGAMMKDPKYADRKNTVENTVGKETWAMANKSVLYKYNSDEEKVAVRHGEDFLLLFETEWTSVLTADPTGASATINYSMIFDEDDVPIAGFAVTKTPEGNFWLVLWYKEGAGREPDVWMSEKEAKIMSRGANSRDATFCVPFYRSTPP
jgi:hypothetical protein